MKELSLEEKIAQMFLIRIEGKEISKTAKELIQKYKIGGVILYRRNYDNIDEMIEMVNKLKELNQPNEIPLFISIDQEGGRVNRMPYDFKNVKNAGAIASTENLDMVRKSGELLSKLILSVGVNMNYAPVLDIRRFTDDNHAIGNRCYGYNKEDVSKYGIEVMKTMQNSGIVPVIKHFPGHGSSMKDSHFSVPVVRKKKEELEKDDMIPFENAIKENADAIMVGHLVIKDMDKRYPASLSKDIIHNYLINKYKFNGLIITDDLKMLAIKLRYTNSKAVSLAINAGNNMIMMGYKEKEVVRIINVIAKKVRKNKININNIDNSINKIITIKNKYNVNDNQISKTIDIDKINDEIEKLNKQAEEQSENK